MSRDSSGPVISAHLPGTPSPVKKTCYGRPQPDPTSTDDPDEPSLFDSSMLPFCMKCS